VEIESVSHKALRRFIETGKPKGLSGDVADRLFRMVNFIIDADGAEELATPPNFGFHELKGDRKGTCAMTVTRNWRMTFKITEHGGIADLDLEDYH
jgi:proteic killer suppression protein